MSDQPTLSMEQALWARSFARVAGIDEAGRGAWAGPVVAAAVILPPGQSDIVDLLAHVRDSKQLTPRAREACYDVIAAHALAYAVGSATCGEIDRRGILPATRLAMRRAVEGLALPPDYLLIDAVRLGDLPIPQDSRPKADRTILSVAAASIVAKVSRDRWMASLDEQNGGYGFAQHKGYGTRAHQQALLCLGPTCHHRASFAPLRTLSLSRRG